MIGMRHILATAAVAALVIAGGPALAQKSGGILQDVPLRQPGQHVDPRGGDRLRPIAPMMGGVQQPRHVRPARGAEQPADRSCPTSPTELGVERGRQAS